MLDINVDETEDMHRADGVCAMETSEILSHLGRGIHRRQGRDYEDSEQTKYASPEVRSLIIDSVALGIIRGITPQKPCRDLIVRKWRHYCGRGRSYAYAPSYYPTGWSLGYSTP